MELISWWKGRGNVRAWTGREPAKCENSLSGAAAGVSAKLSTVGTAGPLGRIGCWIRERMRPRFVHSCASGLGAARDREHDFGYVRTGGRGGGFAPFRDGSTLSGVPPYRARGYVELERMGVPLANGESLPIVHWEKRRSAR